MSSWSTPEQNWRSAQAEEREFWGDCRNTFGEELKQQLYMKKMGFAPLPSTYGFDMQGRSVLDVGGGPVSVLLKCVNLKRGKVIEPCDYPAWVWRRYAAADIDWVNRPAEKMDEPAGHWDVGLLYNVLQHTISPEAIVQKLMAVAREVHVFEWIDIPAHAGHPHCLTAENLRRWTGREGTVEMFNGQNELYGKAWYL